MIDEKILLVVGAVTIVGTGIVLALRARHQAKDSIPTQKTEAEAPHLNNQLQQLIDQYLQLFPTDRKLFVDLAYAICGFGPYGQHVQRIALYVDNERWLAFRQAFGNLLKLPAMPDQRSLPRTMQELLDVDSYNSDKLRSDTARDSLVGLLLICFGDFLAIIEGNFDRLQRQQVLGVTISQSNDALTRLKDLKRSYDKIADEDRPFVVDTATERQLAPIHRCHVQQALAYEVRRNCAEPFLQTQIATIAYAICGFGPRGSEVRRLAQHLNHDDSIVDRGIWREFRQHFCRILGIDYDSPNTAPLKALLETSDRNGQLPDNDDFHSFLAHYVFYLETIYARLDEDMIHDLDLTDAPTITNALASLGKCHNFAYPSYLNLFPTPVLTA